MIVHVDSSRLDYSERSGVKPLINRGLHLSSTALQVFIQRLMVLVLHMFAEGMQLRKWYYLGLVVIRQLQLAAVSHKRI